MLIWIIMMSYSLATPRYLPLISQFGMQQLHVPPLSLIIILLSALRLSPAQSSHSSIDRWSSLTYIISFGFTSIFQPQSSHVFLQAIHSSISFTFAFDKPLTPSILTSCHPNSCNKCSSYAANFKLSNFTAFVATCLINWPSYEWNIYIYGRMSMRITFMTCTNVHINLYSSVLRATYPMCTLLVLAGDTLLLVWHTAYILSLQDFSQEDFDAIVLGWQAKMTRSRQGHQCWGLFHARKPQ